MRPPRSPLLIESIGHNVSHLHIFDMDGTLVRTPEPGPGKQLYHASHPKGRSWEEDHGKSWWRNPISLTGPDHAPFTSHPIEKTIKGYRAAKRDKRSRVIIMTGRENTPAMRKAVQRTLNSIGVTGHRPGRDLFLKPPTDARGNATITHYWKSDMLRRFLHEHPNLKHVHMWDDRDHHIRHFAKTLNALGMAHTLHHVQEPEWGGNMPNST